MTGSNDSGIHIGGDVSGQVAIGSSVTQAQSAPDPSTTPGTATILFWAANPVDTEPLQLGNEVRTIEERLRASELRDRFVLEQQWAVRPGDLSDGLLRYAPQIVHFSGHGNPSGDLVLQADDGSSLPVTIAALADLFALAGDSVRCVVFNACYSQAQAEAVAEHVDCVVGTSRAIEDEAAVRFAAGFYRALGYGRDVSTAFGLGRNEIDLASVAGADIPQLIIHPDVDPTTITF
jgi:hypothetical protein